MIEVPPPPTIASWHKSLASAGGECVEVASSDKYVWVRDSKNREGAVLAFTLREWDAFLTGARRGEFDVRNPAT